MKKIDFFYGILLASFVGIISSCSLFTDENSLENLYPNEFNDSKNYEGQWIFAVNETDWDGYEIIPTNIPRAKDKKYLIGIEMSNGRIQSGSLCKIYRLDSTLIFSGTIELFNEYGHENDPFSYQFQTATNPGISQSDNETLYFRIVGMVRKFDTNSKQIDSFMLDKEYTSGETINSLLGMITGENERTFNQNLSKVEVKFLDSLKKNYGLLSRVSNSAYTSQVIDIVNKSTEKVKKVNANNSGNGNSKVNQPNTAKPNITSKSTSDSDLEQFLCYCDWCGRGFYSIRSGYYLDDGGGIGSLPQYLQTILQANNLYGATSAKLLYLHYETFKKFHSRECASEYSYRN